LRHEIAERFGRDVQPRSSTVAKVLAATALAAGAAAWVQYRSGVASPWLRLGLAGSTGVVAYGLAAWSLGLVGAALALTRARQFARRFSPNRTDRDQATQLRLGPDDARRISPPT
jgi:hypothetical protein